VGHRQDNVVKVTTAAIVMSSKSPERELQ